MSIWFKEHESYVNVMALPRFPDHDPKFKVGNRVVSQHAFPGLTGHVTAVLDPRGALMMLGPQQYDTHLHEWASFCRLHKYQVSELHVYAVQFEKPEVVFPVDPRAPDKIKEAYRRWNRVTAEADLELHDVYWAKMTLDMHGHVVEQPVPQPDVPFPGPTAAIPIDFDGAPEGGVAVMEEEGHGEDAEEAASQGEAEDGPPLSEGRDGDEAGDGDEERQE